MPGLPRRAPHLYILGMAHSCRRFCEAAIDQIVELVAFSMHGFDPRSCQAAIRTAGVDVDRNDHLVFRRRYDLHVVSGRQPPSAIFITRASASVVEARGSFCLATSFLCLLSPFPFSLQCLHALLRRRDPPRVARHALCARWHDRLPRIRLDFSTQALHPRLRRCEQIIKSRVPTELTRPGTRATASHPAPKYRATPTRPAPSTRRPAPEPLQNRIWLGRSQAVIVHRHPAA